MFSVYTCACILLIYCFPPGTLLKLLFDHYMYVIMLHCDKMFGHCKEVTQSMSIWSCTHVQVYDNYWLQFAGANLIGGGACVTQLIKVIIVLNSIGIDFKRHCIFILKFFIRGPRMQQAGGKFCYLWLMKQLSDSLFLAYQLQGSPIFGNISG